MVAAVDTAAGSGGRVGIHPPSPAAVKARPPPIRTTTRRRRASAATYPHFPPADARSIGRGLGPGTSHSWASLVRCGASLLRESLPSTGQGLRTPGRAPTEEGLSRTGQGLPNPTGAGSSFRRWCGCGGRWVYPRVRGEQTHRNLLRQWSEDLPHLPAGCGIPWMSEDYLDPVVPGRYGCGERDGQPVPGHGVFKPLPPDDAPCRHLPVPVPVPGQQCARPFVDHVHRTITEEARLRAENRGAGRRRVTRTVSSRSLASSSLRTSSGSIAVLTPRPRASGCSGPPTLYGRCSAWRSPQGRPPVRSAR